MSAALLREDKVKTYRKWVGVTARQKARDWSYFGQEITQTPDAIQSMSVL